MRCLSAAVVAGLLLAGCADERGGAKEPVDDFGQELEVTDDTGAIRGIVIDATIRPIEGVEVAIESLELAMTTDEEGRFGFSKVPPGLHFLKFSKIGYNSTQQSTTVEAGVSAPPLIRVQLAANPGTAPMVVPSLYQGYLACGAAIIATSVGCTTLGQIADLTSSQSVWRHRFASPDVQWTQGELVWDHTQAAGGMLIWEITARRNAFEPDCHRETTESPALAYCPTDWLHKNPDDNNDALEEGITYRFFGGPHPLCTGVFFGCGLTIDQDATAYVHDFYNMVPDEGWRFTVDGDHPLPG